MNNQQDFIQRINTFGFYVYPFSTTEEAGLCLDNWMNNPDWMEVDFEDLKGSERDILVISSGSLKEEVIN